MKYIPIAVLICAISGMFTPSTMSIKRLSRLFKSKTVFAFVSFLITLFVLVSALALFCLTVFLPDWTQWIWIAIMVIGLIVAGVYMWKDGESTYVLRCLIGIAGIVAYVFLADWLGMSERAMGVVFLAIVFVGSAWHRGISARDKKLLKKDEEIEGLREELSRESDACSKLLDEIARLQQIIIDYEKDQQG